MKMGYIGSMVAKCYIPSLKGMSLLVLEKIFF